MLKHIVIVFLAASGLIILLRAQTGNPPEDYSAKLAQANEFYERATHQLKLAGDDDTKLAVVDSLFREAWKRYLALNSYLKTPGHELERFTSRLKTGFIAYFVDSLNQAKADYQEAIALRPALGNRVQDTLLFLPYLYTGAVFYYQNDYDSSVYYYKMAEKVSDESPRPLYESQRLFNRLGVMFYDAGNYRQARNYFEKAINLLEQGNSTPGMLAAYRLNIASLLVKLEDYSSARRLYESLLPNADFENEIYHNIGIIALREQEPRKALAAFNKVRYDADRKNTDLCYNKALAHDMLGNADSADLWVLRAQAENIRWNGRRANATLGLIEKFQGDRAARMRQYDNASEFYQQALTQFSPRFSNTDPATNPDQFTASGSYINLFNTLSAKAENFKNQFDETKNVKHLRQSLAAYETAFRLADYVAATYDSDEARLFLNRIKHTAHARPIAISLQLFELTGDKSYLNEAYVFDQRNKASVLALNVQENQLKQHPGEAGNLLREEARIRSVITRLSLKSAAVSDSAALDKIYSDVRDQEIMLSKVREQLRLDPDWQLRQANEQIPPVPVLQKALDPSTALLSYHLAETELLVLIITSGNFEYVRVPVSRSFFTDIDSLKYALQNTNADERYSGTETAISLYRQLISPVLPHLQQKKRLIIIPDDELNYLPFEALQDERKNFLLEKFAIQYQFATSLILPQGKPTVSPGLVAFAPFAKNGFTDSNTAENFTVLPASAEETVSLSGKVYTGEPASKQAFLQMANHFGILHLATHAKVDNEDPSRSFIAFYPGTPDYKLFAREIYDLHLDSIQLIILSACETGAGQLVKGEGLMSLSRAFTYAGCPNIITSLWKAEDKATAFITRRLHEYLQQKYTRDEALQAAKLDLLRNAELDPRYRSPRFWAHLIYIGNYESERQGRNWWSIAMAIIGGGLVYQVAKNLKRKKSQA